MTASFTCRAWPLSPTRVTFGPIASSTGLIRAYASSLPPIMIASWPCSRVVRLPETGASTIIAPASATRAASRRLASGEIVDMSAQTAPGPRPAMIPSSPVATSSTAAVSVTIERTTSAPDAQSRGLVATLSPRAASASALAGVRFQPLTSYPPASRRSAIRPPIDPRPTNAIDCTIPGP